MNNPLYPLFTATHLVAAGIALAQAPSPTAAVVAPIPQSGRWELVRADAKSTPGETVPGENPIRIVITRTGAIQKIEVEFASGSPLVVWIADGEVYAEVNKVLSSSRLSGWTPELYTATQAYYGTAWVSEKNHLGRTKIGEQDCDFYQTTAPREIDRAAAEAMGLKPESIAVLQQAWIDPVTRKPVAVLVAEGLMRYNFLESPSAPLELPAAFRLKQQERAREVARQQAEAAVR